MIDLIKKQEDIQADATSILADTDDLQGNQGAWATAVGFSTHSAADVWSVGTRALTDKAGFALSATGANLILKDSTFALAMADATWDELLTGSTHNIATSAGRRLREVGAYAIHSGTAQTGNSVHITLAATASSDDGVYNRNLLVIVGGTGAGQTRTIVDYNGTSKIALADRDWRVQPDSTSEYQIVPDDTPLIVDHGLAVAGTSNTITLRSYASSVNDTYIGGIVTIVAGTARGESQIITGYNGTSKVATTCGNWTTTPNTSSVYVLMPYGVSAVSCISDSAVDSIIDEAIDGTHTLREILRLLSAYAVGKSSGGGTATITFRDIDDTKDRIVATVTTEGNRTATTLTED